MVKLKLNDLFNITSAVIYNPDDFNSISSVVIDSRIVKKNSLFIAVKGSNFDGHDFVNEAVKKGAAAVIINKNKLSKYDDINVPIVAVDDTIKALGEIANSWRRKLKAKVISITGSNGKTSTKEILSTLLSKKFTVVKTVSNNNNHIGVPLTILSANSKTDILVLEHGTNHFNEIEYTAKIAEPDYGLITNIGNSHLQFLKDKQGVFVEKKTLLDEVILRRGFIFINKDDKILKKYQTNFKQRITFGFSADSMIEGKILGYTTDGKTKIKIQSPKYNLEIELPLYGKTNAKNILAAVAVCYKLGLTKKELIEGIKLLKAAKSRLDVIHGSKMILIDDTYNANPESMKSAFELVDRIKLFKKKILVLGDMFELGSKAKDLHLELASSILKLKPDFVLTIGKNMKALSLAITGKIIIRHFNSLENMKIFLMKNDFSNSVILVKGSRGMKMEEMIQPIIEGKN